MVNLVLNVNLYLAKLFHIHICMTSCLNVVTRILVTSRVDHIRPDDCLPVGL